MDMELDAGPFGDSVDRGSRGWSLCQLSKRNNNEGNPVGPKTASDGTTSIRYDVGVGSALLHGPYCPEPTTCGASASVGALVGSVVASHIHNHRCTGGAVPGRAAAGGTVANSPAMGRGTDTVAPSTRVPSREL